jgi:hypothetical protein
MLAARRRRVTSLDDEQPLSWVPDELVLAPRQRLVTSIEPDRSWCLPSAGDQQQPRVTDPIWRLLDRWSRSGSYTHRSGAADVHRVVRVPPSQVRDAIAGWAGSTIRVGSSSLTVASLAPAVLEGMFAPAGSRRAQVQIGFERWSPSHLCAHFRPVGRSRGRSGSVAWWAGAHEVLDELLDRLAIEPHHASRTSIRHPSSQ